MQTVCAQGWMNSSLISLDSLPYYNMVDMQTMTFYFSGPKVLRCELTLNLLILDQMRLDPNPGSPRVSKQVECFSQLCLIC
jgi:hypothetical protein